MEANEDLSICVNQGTDSCRLKSAKKLSVAKLRWKMLSKALKEGPSSVQMKPPLGSSRHFASFGLLMFADKKYDEMRNDSKKYKNQNDSDEKGKWYRVTSCEDNDFFLEVRLLTEKIPLKELFYGADNTGNICLWPSEEVLAYYCIKNKELFNDKVVCELGGGMTCLSGLIVAATSNAKKVILTDGNERCLQNVRDIVERNSGSFGETVVECTLLKWGNNTDIDRFTDAIDVILCSDCLYYDDGRQPLVNTIWSLLKSTGVAVVLAPLRGQTFQQFVELTREKFETEQVMVYDTTVWEVHENLMKTMYPHTYKPELHYPRMIVLRKPSNFDTGFMK
ncbi:calmodulin-lysine N-methyltransferase-like protein [Dinothrombium tinctorium]|uniref:Calmodulin-lysine N-methyltransferase n=1 Tax=Dinothrombium tinctorium TaxID=1965070 RepID=A0A443QLQ9_9ACAR|nr:calmodulin-lysine N-methyltransferase-like protein [Dinothrombium tinctorium]